jgi:glycosyltransferase involved in cell wall biosynthesis
VAAFNTGGLPDIVEHERTGYLAKAFESEDLAQGIAWVLAQRNSGQQAQETEISTSLTSDSDRS